METHPHLVSREALPVLIRDHRIMTERELNILLVEDDEVDVMNVRRALRRNQIQSPLFVAKNGLEGLAKLKSASGHPPEVPVDRRMVLLDLNMPRMGGLEFLEAVREDPELKSTPVVVLTTSDDEYDRLQAYRLNVAGYILKPVKFANFADTMAALAQYWSVCEMP